MSGWNWAHVWILEKMKSSNESGHLELGLNGGGISNFYNIEFKFLLKNQNKYHNVDNVVFYKV
jgi:hypothetical protein